MGGVRMNCMKCGRDIEEGQVFCDLCLEDMQNYPVKPNIAVQLPHRDDSTLPKKVTVKRRQPPTAEEQLHAAKRILRRILILWLVTLCLLIASLYPAVRFLLGDAIRLPGQNYSTFSTAPTGGTAPAASTPPTTTP